MLNLDRSTWKTHRFGDLVRNVNESVKNVAESGIEHLIALEHLDPGEITLSRYGRVADGTTFTRRVRPGQTLFGKRRAYQRKAAYAEADAICSGDILVFEAMPGQISPRLLPFLVHSEAFFDHALGTSAGSLSPRTSWKALADFEVALPEIDEQERIADLLWAIEEHKLRVQEHSSAASTLHDPLLALRLGDDCEYRTLESLCTALRDGPFGSKIKSEHYTDDANGVRVLRLQDVARGEISQISLAMLDRTHVEQQLTQFRVAEGDVVMAGLGDDRVPPGRSAVVRSREAGSVHKADVYRLVPRTEVVSPEYLSAVINSAAVASDIRRRCQGTTRLRLNTKTVRGVKVPVLSKPCQDELLHELASVTQASAALSQELDSVREIYRAVIGEVFGGAS